MTGTAESSEMTGTTGTSEMTGTAESSEMTGTAETSPKPGQGSADELTETPTMLDSPVVAKWPDVSEPRLPCPAADEGADSVHAAGDLADDIMTSEVHVVDSSQYGAAGALQCLDTDHEPRGRDGEGQVDELIMRALMSSNLLRLVGDASYVQGLKEKMRIEVSQRRRDSLDFAGKLPLALKALSIGIPADQLLIDVAQAGGLHGKSDGCIIVGPQRQVSGSSRGEPVPLCREPLEVKSSSCRSGDRTFGIKSIRRSFRHLFIVGRKDNPNDWTSLDALDDKCSLGYISGEDYDIALERHLVRQGRWPAASNEPQ